MYLKGSFPFDIVTSIPVSYIDYWMLVTECGPDAEVHPKPEPRDPKPETPDPKPTTRNPKPKTRTPRPEIYTPEPEARNPETRAGQTKR